MTEVRWLRDLAQKLARDPHVADDLAQSTWTAALETSPEPRDNLRGWLGAVLKNFWAQGLRRDARRLRREREVARHYAQASTAELVTELETQRRVLEAVLDLDEIYRSVVVLRHFCGLPPREIAERLELSVATVKTRLHRAHTRLRAALRDLDTGRHPTLALWFGWPSGLGSLSLGAIGLNSKLVIGAGALALGVVATWMWFDPVPALSPGPGIAQRAGQAPVTAAVSSPAGAGRSPAVAAVQEPIPPVTEVRFTGRVVDVSDRPVAGVAIVMRGGAGTERATSDAGGGFALPVPATARELAADEPGMLTVLSATVGPSTARGAPPVVVVAEAIEVDLLVMDEGGTPLDNARVTCPLPRDFRSRFRLVLDHAAEPLRHALTDTAGRARFVAGAVPGAELSVRLHGYLPAVAALPPNGEPVTVVLKRPAPRDGVVLGLVTDLAGAPVDDVMIAVERASTNTDGSGRFALPLEAAENARRLVAMKAGYQPAVAVLEDADVRREPGASPAFLHLILGEPPRQIAGRVVDPSGRPVRGAKVWARDSTTFGMWNRRPLAVESYLAEAESAWNWVRSGDDGEFVIGGLLSRPYTLGALASSTQHQVDAGPFEAGSSGVTIVLDDDDLHDRIAGRIVTGAGRPVAGVRVQAKAWTHRLDYETQGTSFFTDQDGPIAETDGDGRFEFRRLSGHRLYLSLSADEIMPRVFPVGELPPTFPVGNVSREPSESVDALEIVVEMRVHLQVELADPEFADAIGALDAAGEPLWISSIRGNIRNMDDRPPIHNGRTDVLAVTERAATLLLFKGGAEVHRQPVKLRPGLVHRIKL